VEVRIVETNTPGSATTMRLVARVVGVLAVAMWIMIFVGGLIAENPEPLTTESYLLIALSAGAAVGVAWAFVDEKAGGLITLVVGVAFAVFALVTAGRNAWLAVLFSGGPFILAGAFFLGSWYRRGPRTM
jgi:DMSO reductase anchor subunit